MLEKEGASEMREENYAPSKSTALFAHEIISHVLGIPHCPEQSSGLRVSLSGQRAKHSLPPTDARVLLNVVVVVLLVVVAGGKKANSLSVSVCLSLSQEGGDLSSFV